MHSLVDALVRRRALAYAAIAQLAAGTLDLIWWIAPGPIEFTLGWIALGAALVGLFLWGAATLTRRFALSDFYVRPCFHMAILLTAVAAVSAFDARFLGRESFRLGVLALAMSAW